MWITTTCLLRAEISAAIAAIVAANIMIGTTGWYGKSPSPPVPLEAGLL